VTRQVSAVMASSVGARLVGERQSKVRQGRQAGQAGKQTGMA
jgi:hypothetical protein